MTLFIGIFIGFTLGIFIRQQIGLDGFGRATPTGSPPKANGVVRSRIVSQSKGENPFRKPGTYDNISKE